MSVQVEKLENNMAKLTVEVSAERFEAAIEQVYKRNRSRIVVPGFRKGKAPRKMIEHAYGAGVFYEDAANLLIPEAYDEALLECGETIVSRPSIDIVQIEAGKPFIFTAEAALKPEVVLGEYKGLAVEVPAVTVTDEDVQKELDSQRDKNARMVDVTDRPVEDGDLIKLDFDGSIDGEPFEGGKSDDYPLTIGSGSFIPGFEEQLIGTAIGEEKDVTVTFPEEYHAEELRGKEAVFKCKVNSIQKKELPEVDDEFAQDVSEFDTLEEYKEDIRRKLKETREADAKRMKETAVVEKIVENASMDIPEGMIDEQVSRMIDDFRRRVESQGMALEKYLEYTGMDVAKLADSMRPEALKRIQNSLVLEAVAKAENIEISEERVDEEIAKMAEQYQMEADKLKEMMGEYEIGQMKEDLKVQAAVDFVRDNAVETELAE
ncbi:MAG: trigger factor [Lachnospiraceae bacterium]|nr:trigger factor [Lachnospiraceae bacterium]